MSDYERIERAIAYLDEHFREQPGVAEVAAHVGLSESQFHRLFQRWAGITPKRFLAVVTAAHARRLLEDSQTVLDSAWASGLSGSGRLHDLFVGLEGVTPGQVRQRGQGLRMTYGFPESPFGPCLLAFTERGVSALSFVPEDGREPSLDALIRKWPEATFERDDRAAGATLERMLDTMQGDSKALPRLAVRGTNFQVRVWEALLRIPPGRVASYRQIAEWTGQPAATRAVGTAVGANPVPLLIPCHRVILSSGAFGNYSGGALRKRAILAWEAGRCHGDDI